MDAAFIIVLAISLCLLSAMIAFRMAAGGAPARRVVLTVAELWLVFALWMVLLGAAAAALGTPSAGGGLGELQELASKVVALQGAARLWLIAGAAASVALLAHLLWSLRRGLSHDLRG